MPFVNKTRINNEGTLIKKYQVFHLTFFKKVIGEKISMWILGIPIARFTNKKHPFYLNNDFTLFSKELRNKKHTILWIDHSLGGGTNVYTENQIKENHRYATYVRMQYFAYYKTYTLTLYNDIDPSVRLTFASLNDLMKVLNNIKIDEIVVNNIVGYPKSTDILECVNNYKKRVKGNIKVSFKGHDYHCICPSFNLLNSNGQYCRLSSNSNCEQCLKSIRLAESDWENDILWSGATDMQQWRKEWSAFFTNTLDEFVVFSEEVAKIFFSIYPQLDSKTILIPHKTRTFPTVNITPHKEINIAFLGEMDLPCKGKDILKQMVNIIDEYENVYLHIIGSTTITHKKLTSTGAYTPEDLPSLMERAKIDLVFISSIWPETFSYTTSETISMGLPIACFDFGAPRERVSQYPHGLIINKIDARYALERIIEFVKQERNQL